MWAHASRASDNDLQLLQHSGSTFVSTASTELQMGHRLPLAHQNRANKLRRCTSIGIKEMRLGLQAARAIRNRHFHARGLEPAKVRPLVEDAFNLGTIYGARAIGMGDMIGCIEENKRADLVIFDCTTPSMLCGASHSPIALIMLHSGPRDVQHVIVDGIFRKKDGVLHLPKWKNWQKVFLGPVKCNERM